MDETVSPRVLSELSCSIYDCVLDPDLWEPTLGCIRDALGCQNAQLSLLRVPIYRHPSYWSGFLLLNSWL